MTSLAGNLPFQISTSDPVNAIRNADTIIVGQLGQTLDGCIATSTGDSKYINSEGGLRHLHAVRSAVDAVIVGVGSVIADNPKLTVRLCEGDHPARVIIDPNGRVDMNAGLFSDDCAEVIVITREGLDHPASDVAEVIPLPNEGGTIDPALIVNRLKQSGVSKILVEGGNRTLSTFMDAGVIDRLHLIVAPMIMGCGKPGLQMQPIDKLCEALRPSVVLHPLGGDILFDCNFRQQQAKS